MANFSVSPVRITNISRNGTEGKLQVQQQKEDLLAVEEPLEISLVYGEKENRKLQNLSVTMCTPGHEEELATGFLFTEGLINGRDDILSITQPALTREDHKVQVELSPRLNFDPIQLERHFYTSSSCGVCGKSSIKAVKRKVGNRELREIGPAIEAATILSLSETLRKEQEVFEQTGGLHASALFDLKGNLLMLREDVGRHNALDKLIGAALEKNLLPLDQHILLLSGRASFELIQKAAMASIRIVCAVGAPSSLAVQMAEDCGLTLVGFLREKKFNIYTGESRLSSLHSHNTNDLT